MTAEPVSPQQTEKRRIIMKQQNSLDTVLSVSVIVLGVAGIALALLSIFGNITAKWPLPAALLCVVLGQACNIIYSQRKNKK